MSWKALYYFQYGHCFFSARLLVFFRKCSGLVWKLTLRIWDLTSQYPISSMYGIFAYIYHKNQPNVGKYTIHGSLGIWKYSRNTDFDETTIPCEFSPVRWGTSQVSVSDQKVDSLVSGSPGNVYNNISCEGITVIFWSSIIQIFATIIV